MSVTYSFACFISYKRPPKVVYPNGVSAGPPVKHVRMEFAEAFEKRLARFLNTSIPIFRDEYLWPGSDYPVELFRNLCRSVCMVALVVPEYFESSWCRAEWSAMQAFEKDRLKNGQRGLIIPVVCVGDTKTLDPLLDGRNRVDLRNLVRPVRELDNLSSLRKISGIADIINRYASTLQPPDIDCGTFSLDIGPEEITPTISEPAPFGSAEHG